MKMLIHFVNLFVKITGWPVQFVCFRTKILYEDKEAQSRRIKGKAIVISNHTSVFDYAVMMFVFFGRTLRYQMAEVLFNKKFLGPFLRTLGGIRVDRNIYDFSFMAQSQSILDEGGVVGIFPEGRLPRAGEERPLPFRPSGAYLAMLSKAPVIPVYTNGSYFCKKRAVVLIGKKFYAKDLTDPALSEKENISLVNDAMRQRIIELEKEYNELSVF